MRDSWKSMSDWHLTSLNGFAELLHGSRTGSLTTPSQEFRKCWRNLGSIAEYTNLLESNKKHGSRPTSTHFKLSCVSATDQHTYQLKASSSLMSVMLGKDLRR